MSTESTSDQTDRLVEETQTFWHDVGKSLIRGSARTIDGTAKQIIAVAAILEGLYFHAIAFGNLRGQITTTTLLVVYLAPIALLLVSLAAALFVFFPSHYRLNFRSWEACQLVYERVVARKLFMLRLGSLALLGGVAAMGFAVLTYLQN
ncbi:MAG: hypothetical protein U0822_22835 [Anaerolineae bacterium]